MKRFLTTEDTETTEKTNEYGELRVKNAFTRNRDSALALFGVRKGFLLCVLGVSVVRNPAYGSGLCGFEMTAVFDQLAEKPDDLILLFQRLFSEFESPFLQFDASL